MAEETNYPSLEGKRVSTTYGGVLHLPHSLVGTKNNVYDGKGTPTSLTLGGVGQGIDVTGNVIITGSTDIAGNTSIGGNLSATGDIKLIAGGNINDLIIGNTNDANTLIVPRNTEVGKLRIRETDQDYELIFGNSSVADSNLFTIMVKKASGNNLFIKNNYADADVLSPLWINRATGEVNIRKLKVVKVTNVDDPDSPPKPPRPPQNSNFIPTGMIAPFPTLAVPDGWFMCDGSFKDTLTFPELFEVLGYAYGGAGPNFKLPDYRELFMRGHGGRRGYDPTPARTPGSFQADDLKAHTHTYSTYGYEKDSTSGGDNHAGDPTSGTTSSAGGPETRPKNIAVAYCIKW